MNMYGNMTSVEKAMNRAELQSYKNNDTKQYSLVPGVNHNKQISMMDAASNPSVSPKKNVSIEDKMTKQMNNLNSMGYNETGQSKHARINPPVGRNFGGVYTNPYNHDVGSPNKPQDMYAGGGNLNLGER